MKGKNLPPRLLYPARLSFRTEGEIKSFTDIQKLREFSNTKPVLQQILKELLQAEEKRPQPETKILQITRLTSKGIYKDMKSSMHNYATKIRNCEKRWVQMQDTEDALAIKRPRT